MEFYPQRVYGVEWNDEFVNKLVEWDVEEHGDFSLDLDHGEDFCYMLQDEYEISAQVREFEWVRGGYIQGLYGLQWGTTYLVIDEDDKDKIPLLEEKLGVTFEEGGYSELG
tara:strand:+ start:1057 stop:1389 length:333 start_codon:yes stop_codon:yes gene_type:complete